MQTQRSISAFRVKSTLKEVVSVVASEKWHVLARQSSFVSSFFIVPNDWKEQMDIEKQVTVFAEISCSAKSGQIHVEKFHDISDAVITAIVKKACAQIGETLVA